MSSMEVLSPAIHPFLACPVARARQLDAFMPSMDSRMRPGVAFTRSMEESSCSRSELAGEKLAGLEVFARDLLELRDAELGQIFLAHRLGENQAIDLSFTPLELPASPDLGLAVRP